MGKWLAVAGIAILVLLLVLWKQLDATTAVAAPPAAKRAQAPVEAIVAIPVHAADEPVDVPGGPAEPAAGEEPEKIDVESDEFFYRFQEMVPAKLSRNAVKCYEGIAKRVHRNQSLVLKFKTRIRGGVVTIHDVEIENNTLDNPGLTSCFIEEVQRSTWTDETLPDWEAEDQLKLSPERGLKKYTRENLEYVGEPAPQD